MCPKHFVLAVTTSHGNLLPFFVLCVANISKGFFPLSSIYLYLWYKRHGNREETQARIKTHSKTSFNRSSSKQSNTEILLAYPYSHFCSYNLALTMGHEYALNLV